MDPDQPLLEACLARQGRARDEFVDRIAPVVWATVRRVAKGTQDPSIDHEDVVQEVFLRLFKNDAKLLRRFDGDRASLKTWIAVVAQSATLDILRKKRHPTVPFEGDLHGPIQEEPVERRGGIRIPEGILSTKQRLVMHLLFKKDLSVSEAGTLLGISDQTVRSMKHKAVSRLKEYFAHKTLEADCPGPERP